MDVPVAPGEYHDPPPWQLLEERLDRILTMLGWLVRETVVPPEEPDDPLNLADLERKAIILALARSGGCQARAAKLLGVSPRVLNYKIKKLQLQAYANTVSGSFDRINK